MPKLNDVDPNYHVWTDLRDKEQQDIDWDQIQLERWNAIPLEAAGFKFSTRSFKNLSGVDPKLSVIMGSAILSSPYDFAIIEGLRSQERQQELYDEGKTQTLNSRHLTGHAVDIAIFIDQNVTWENKYYKIVSDHIKNIAKQHSLEIEWGGDWPSFVDGVHYQLPWKT